MKKLLPIGSVVLLKQAKKKIMIVGFYASDGKNENITYDYVACPFPEGVISSEKHLLFNHSQIDKICHYGLDNGEELMFKKLLKEVIEDK